MVIVYSIIFVLSLLLPIGYFPYVGKKQKEPWLLILFIAVCIVNFGYLLLSVSKTVEFALFANKVAYFGQVFVPLCMFMIISKLCGISYKKWAEYVLLGAAMVMFSLVLTTGHLDWYYKSVELVYADGAAKLIKEYGPLHPVNLIYVLTYFVGMFIVIGMSIKKSRGDSRKLAGLMFAVVMGNIGMWVVEKLVSLNFEFLSVSYLMSEAVFFFVYWLLQDFIHKNDVSPTTVILPSVIDADAAKELASALTGGQTLTAKEREVLELIIAGQSRKQMAIEMHVSENTVKTHVKHIYEKLGVSGRDEILALAYKE